MRGKRWIVLLVVAMVAVFAGTGQAAVIYANSDDASTGVNNSWNLTGVQDQHYATFSNGNSATLDFAQNFVVTSGDAMIYIEGSLDVLLLSGLTLNAHNSEKYGIDVDAVRVDTGNGGVAPIPEPGTMMLLGSGLIGVACWGRKKFRK